MAMSAPPRQRQDAFYCRPGYQSENTLFHTTRAIKCVFLEGSQNILPLPHASPSFESQVGYINSTKGCYCPFVMSDLHSPTSNSWPPELERLPIFITLSKSQEKASSTRGRPLFSRDRLPIFRQLCEETAMASSHTHEDTVGPEALDGETENPEAAEELGLGKKLERKEGEEAIGEGGSSLPLVAAGERGAQL